MRAIKTIFPCLLAAGFLFLSAPVRVRTAAEGVSKEDIHSLEELRRAPAEEIAKWDSYDSRTFGIVTSVKNQSPSQLCWSYGALAAAETSILREGFDPALTKDNLDLDEEEAAKAACGKFLDPLSLADGNNLAPARSVWDRGGYVDFITRSASHWQGIMDSLSVEQEAQRSYSEFVLENAVKCNNDVEEIKQLVAQYGGVAFEYHEGYNDYHVAKGPVGHVSEIVGWNDKIAKENFAYSGVAVQRDGAWLVKNSWGTERNAGGYFWLSYESDLENITAFDFAPRPDNKLLYHYAGNETSRWFWRSTTQQRIRQIAYTFEPKGRGGEYLSSVMVGVEGKDVNVKVEIYDDLSAAQPAASQEFETHSLNQSVLTLNLDNPVKLKDQPFCVAVTIDKGGFLIDFNGNTGSAKCYRGSGSSWEPLGLNEGQLPVVHSITMVKLEEREGEYEDKLYQKMLAFEGAVKALPAKDLTAENFAGLTNIKKTLDAFEKTDISALWLTDELKIARYQHIVDRWSKLVKDAEKVIEIGKKFL